TDPPGAAILLEPLDPRNKDSRQAQLPADSRGWVFNDLKPGEYRVAAVKPEYHQKDKTVTVVRNKAISGTLDLDPVLYSVPINTNVDAGELKVGKEGATPQFIDFHNRSIKLQLQAGDTVAQITAAAFGYEAASQKFSVTADRVVDLPLKRIVLSTETLAPTWT